MSHVRELGSDTALDLEPLELDTDAQEIGFLRLRLSNLWHQSLVAAEKSATNLGGSLHLPVWYPLITFSHEEGSQIVGKVLVGVECTVEGKGAHKQEAPDLELAAHSLVDAPFMLDCRTRITSLGVSLSAAELGEWAPSVASVVGS
jgi:hypothetical protein